MRDSFVMYTANIDQISLLNMEQRGNLFTAIMLYAADKELPQMDGMTQMAFSFIKAQLDRDNQKYQKMIESRRISIHSTTRVETAILHNNHYYSSTHFHKQIISHPLKSRPTIPAHSQIRSHCANFPVRISP